ncbi:MAG: hypothetical protein B1H08_02285 [Candidatus Omnitrophica bacterium 4484_171]|nr:MAG: hypothetical protein B1H08_02285 [Candidatus Omnitrophica bacterium 4484_171]
MANILSLILDNKKKRITVLKKNRDGLLSLIKKAPRPRSFRKAINRESRISLIAELKQASPSAGVLRKDFSLIDLARIFSEAKVDAISVLTEEDFFLGKISYIEDIRKVTNIPVLRKDFIIDEVQVLESRAAGADAILLIVRLLDNERLERLYSLAKDLNMDVVVEVHTQKELRRVIPLYFDIIGINNRSLDTLTIDLNTTAKLAPFISKDSTIVSESGVSTLKDMLWLRGLGVNAVLVGEAIMKSLNVKDKIKELSIDG